MTLMKNILATLALVLLAAVSANAQTALTTTTLSSAVTDTTGQQWFLTSLTGVTAPGTGAALTFLYVDGEAVSVRAINTNATSATVSRGALGTRAATHSTNAIVYVIPAVAAQTNLQTVDYSGTCTATNYQYLPIINVRNGNIWYCQTTTSGSIWQAANFTPIRENNPRVPVAGVAYTVLPTDTIVALSTISNAVATKTFTLPSHVGLQGKLIVVMDESGGLSATTSVILAGTINGTNSSVATVVQMKTAFQSVGLYAGSGGWFLLWCNTASAGLSGPLQSCR